MPESFACVKQPAIFDSTAQLSLALLFIFYSGRAPVSGEMLTMRIAFLVTLLNVGSNIYVVANLDSNCLDGVEEGKPPSPKLVSNSMRIG